MADQIGSVEVEVRANLTGLVSDFEKGRVKSKEFARMASADAAVTQQALAQLDMRGATSLGRLTEASDASASGFTRVSEAATVMSGIVDTKMAAATLGVSRLSRVFTALLNPIGAVTVATIGYVGAMARGSQEAEKFARAQRLTESFLKATGHAAGLTAKDIRALADEVSDATLFPTEEIISAANQLLMFRGVQDDVFRETIRVAADVANVFGDVESATIAIGRALQDPSTQASMLDRATKGVIHSQLELAKRLDESGDKAGAVRTILKALTDTLGGGAAGQSTGFTGAVNRAADAYGNLLERIGNASKLRNAGIGWALLAEKIAKAASQKFVPTDAERLDQVNAALAEMEPLLAKNRELLKYGDSGAMDLKRRVDGLRAEKLALEGVVDANTKAAAAEKERTAAETAATRARDAEIEAAEKRKELAPDILGAQSAEIDNMLALAQARNAAEAAQDEAYNRGRRQSELAVAAIDAEIQALRAKKALAETASADNDKAKVAKEAEISGLQAQIDVKLIERSAAAISQLSIAYHEATVSAREQLTVTQTLAGIYDGTEASIREMAIQEQILTEAQRSNLDVTSEQGKAWAATVRQIAEGNNALQDAIALNRSLQSVRDEIAAGQAEDFASANFGTMSGGLTAEGHAFLKEQQLLNEELRRTGTVSAEAAARIHALASSYGDARAASESFRATQQAQLQFMQQTIDLTADLGGAMLRDSQNNFKNWKDILLSYFGEVATSYIRMVGQMAQAQAGQGAGGGFNWAGLITSLIGAAGGAAAGGGGSIAGADPGGGIMPVTHPAFHAGTPSVSKNSASRRSVPAEIFLNAPSYHRGIASVRPRLRPNEVPAILEEGETVLPRGSRMGGRGGGTTNVWNISGVDADTFQRSQRQIQRKGQFALGIRGRV